MKKLGRIAISLMMVVTLTMSSLTSVAFGASEPNLTAGASYLYCATTDEVLWEDNANKKDNIASITKLMTCLIAVEELGLDAEVTVDAEATQVIKSDTFVYAGEKIKVRDLVYGALLASANDAAKALGLAVSGTQKAFAKKMNAKAKKLGCTNTHFTNASGVYSNNQYSCARDVAKIAKAAFANKDIRAIAGTAEYTGPATNKTGQVKLKTTNLLLKGGTVDLPSGPVKVEEYDGVIAGKTGTTNDQRTTMVVLCDIDGFQIYAVIMDSTLQNRFNDVRRLLNYAKQTLNKYTVFKKGAVFGEAKLKGGATNRVEAVSAIEGFINLPEGASASLVSTKTKYLSDLKAPIKKGQKVGTVTIYLADDPVRTINLRASADVEEGWFLSPVGITNFQTVVLLLVIVLMLGFFVFIAAMRASNKKKRKLARQAKLRELARQHIERERDTRQRNWPY